MVDEEPARLHALVTGHVQGVGFRAFVVERALAFDLTGWVRNTYGGDVEVTAEGTRQMLEVLLSDLQRGPRGSYIVDVRFEWGEATGEFPSFDVRRTG